MSSQNRVGDEQRTIMNDLREYDFNKIIGVYWLKNSPLNNYRIYFPILIVCGLNGPGDKSSIS